MAKKDGGFLLPEIMHPDTRCVSFQVPNDQNHLMAFWGALNELTYWFNWQRDVAHTATEAAYKWQLIIQEAHDRFYSENPCGNEIPSDDCRELAPHHPAITWYPHSPYTEPNWTGTGYALGAWYVAQDAGLIDAIPGSVVADVAHVRVGVGENAEFRIRVNGIGEVELHLANVFAGGIGLIRVDGVPVDSVDMSQDSTSVPPESENVTIWEHKFETEGEHEIIVTLAPVVDDSLTPPLRYGGGLVKAVLCGFAPMEANHVIRVQDCVLQQSADGVTWTDIADLTECQPGCELVTECITENAATRQAIIDLILANPELASYFDSVSHEQGLPAEQRNQNLLLPEACEYGYIYNQAVTAVEELHTLTLATILAINGGNTAIERQTLVANMFGVTSIGLNIGFIPQIAQQFIGAISSNYASAATEVLREEIACGLFCVGKDTCVLTIEQIHAYYAEKLAVITPTTTEGALRFMLEYVASGTFPGNAVVYMMHLLVIDAWRSSLMIENVDYTTFGLKVMDAGTVSNPGWEAACDECITSPTVLLVSSPGWNEDWTEFISSDGELDTYRIYPQPTGHYASMAFQSVGGVTFYIHSAEMIEGTDIPQLGMSNGTFAPDDVPCNLGVNSVGVYFGYTTTLEIKVSRNPCVEQTVWLRDRQDGDWVNVTTSWSIVGQTPTGGMIFDLQSSATSGPNGFGVDTVNEAGDTLVSAYLVSATINGVEVYSHYHEQEGTAGVGDGHSGTRPSKKWSWYATGAYGQTLRVTFEPEPY